jgi:DNA-directed RNA polymerase
MPNLIHSLDASNVHLLCDKLANKPLYTIHDCFATTANHMEDLENDIKKAFIEIYFSNGNYLEKMHNSLIDQIKSYNNNIISKNNNEYIQINKTEFLIPKIPDSFIDPKLIKIFINGIKKCKYFIS